jgi:hypothetical protein
VRACLEVLAGRREAFPDGAGAEAVGALRATQDALRRVGRSGGFP